MRIQRHWTLVGSLLVSAGLAHAAGVKVDENAEYKPTGKGWGELADSPGANGHAKAARPGGGTNGISYHGGPVMTGAASVYYIWYGNWVGNSALNILPDLARGLSGSPYFNINTTYTNASGGKPNGIVNYYGSTTDNYSRGTALTDANIQTIVSDAITSGRLPKDTNGVYFVLTSADVNATSGFCTQYCGWHTAGTIASSTIKYSFVGNPDRCPSSCAAQTTGPNGNAGADGMASVIAHEIEEAATDPQLNAWWQSSSGMENADKCAWKFGTTYTTANGQKANMKLGARDFLIQQNWVNSGTGGCALRF